MTKPTTPLRGHRSFIAAHVAAATLVAAATAATATLAEPIYHNGQLTFPAGTTLPKTLTDAESQALADNPWLIPQPAPFVRGLPSAPTGTVITPPEYAPTQAIIVAWQGSSAWKSILAQMGTAITVHGDADYYIAVNSTFDRNEALATLQNSGADMSRVRTFLRATNSIWIRDYGPRFIYNNGIRAIADHTYNRPRPADNAWPIWFAAQEGFQHFALPLIHGGGNFHLAGPDAVTPAAAWATSLIDNENPSLTASQIINIWQAYQGVDTTLTPALPASVDATQHIDMWAIPVSDDTFIVSDWPAQPGTTQAIICNNFAADMSAAGYNVIRTPARTVSGTHYTYTNAVICNDIVLVPSYTNALVSPYNAQAVAAWQQAMPGKTIITIDCQSLVTFAGVMHCIVMHMPKPITGDAPAVRIDTPDSPTSIDPKQTLTIAWTSEDDIAVTNVQLRLSTDAGQTYPTIIATGLPSVGSYEWTVNIAGISDARILVTAEDADNNATSVATQPITINYCLADHDRSGEVNIADYFFFLTDFFEQLGGPGSADLNNDGVVAVDDYFIFLSAYFEPCP